MGRFHLRNDRLPVAFEPEAGCPQWQRFPRRALGDDVALVRYVQRADGSSLRLRFDKLAQDETLPDRGDQLAN